MACLNHIILKDDVLFQLTTHLYSEAIMHHNMEYIFKIDKFYENSLILLNRCDDDDKKIITSRCIYKTMDLLEKKVRMGSPTNDTDFYEVFDECGKKRLAMTGNDTKLYGFVENLHKFISWNENFRKDPCPDYIL